MKLALRARSPATEDSTISRPWPWWRIRPATASRADGQTGVVGGHHRRRRHRVALVHGLVAEHAGGRDDQVEVAEAVEDLVGEGLVVGRCRRRRRAPIRPRRHRPRWPPAPPRRVVRPPGRRAPPSGNGPGPAWPRWPGRSPRNLRAPELTGAVRWRRSWWRCPFCRWRGGGSGRASGSVGAVEVRAGGGLDGLTAGAGRCTVRAFDRDRSAGRPRGRPGRAPPAIRRRRGYIDRKEAGETRESLAR